MSVILDILVSVIAGLFTTLIQLLLLLGPFILSGIVLHVFGFIFYVRSVQVFGTRLPVYLLGMVGTLVHEGSHAIGAALFGHQIVSFSLFSPDDETGQLGNVQTAFDRSNGWHQFGAFFCGVAPLLMAGVVFCLLGWMLGFKDLVVSPWRAAGIVVDAQGDLFGTLGQQKDAMVAGFRSLVAIENLMNWKFWLFLYLIASIGSQCGLSGPDCHGCGYGSGPFLGIAFIILLIVNVCASLFALFDQQTSHTLLSVLVLVTQQVCQLTYAYLAVVLFPLVFAAMLCGLVLLPMIVVGSIVGRLTGARIVVADGPMGHQRVGTFTLAASTICENIHEFFAGLEES